MDACTFLGLNFILKINKTPNLSHVSFLVIPIIKVHISCYDMTSKKLFITRHVQFIEHEFPFHSKSQLPSMTLSSLIYKWSSKSSSLATIFPLYSTSNYNTNNHTSSSSPANSFIASCSHSATTTSTSTSTASTDNESSTSRPSQLPCQLSHAPLLPNPPQSLPQQPIRTYAR